MYRGGLATRCLTTLAGGFLLTLIVVSNAVPQSKTIRESYDNTLKANEKRIQEIEAKERGTSDPLRRAEKITRDKIAGNRALLKGGGSGKSLAGTAEKAAGDPRALAELSTEQSRYLDAVTSDWAADGSERKRVRDAIAVVRKNMERGNASLTSAAKTAESVQSSEALGKATRIEAALNAAAERLRARWQLEQAAREREMKQREREAAERARSSGTR